MVRAVARNLLAACCLLVGVAGIFLPVIPGVALLAVGIVLADFPAKERILRRYRHTRVGAHFWAHHEARLARDAARNGIVPESAPPPPATGEAASAEK